MPKFLDNVISKIKTYNNQEVDLNLSQDLAEVCVKLISGTYEIYFSPFIISYANLGLALGQSFDGGKMFYLYEGIFKFMGITTDSSLPFVGTGYDRSNTSNLKILNIYRLRKSSSTFIIDGLIQNTATQSKEISLNPINDTSSCEISYKTLFR